ncbi:MAG: phage tail tape measure protein, partial [Phascolarctobacterium sp.]|nr:phage tail tape measure protein [Phascolarctobacterium sp.]
AEAPLISDVVTRIGPLGEVGGIASGEIAALGASLIGSGIQSEVAATGIKNLILTMTAGAGATKSQADAFSTLGLDAEYVAVKMQKDAKGAIIEVLGALRDLDKVQQATTLAKLFGKESLGAIAPLLSNLEVLSENFSKVADSSQYSSSMQKEFEEKANSTENKIRLMNQSIRAASITIGKNFIPILHPFITIVSESAKVIGDFASEYPGLTKSMFGAAIGIGTFSAAVYACKGIYNVWKSVEAGYLMFKEMQIATKGAAMTQMFFNTTLAACPVTWLIAGISALVVSGYVLYKNWDQITDWLILLWNDPIKAIQKFTDILGTAVNWAKEKWENLKNMLSIPIFGNIKIATTEVKSSAIGVAQNSKGGIYSQGAFLTTFAENSPEAAIPIDGSQRAKNLWAQTGEMLGIGSGSPVQVTFSPTITIQGNASREDVNRAMDLTLDKLEEMLTKLSHRQRRLSYG